MTLPLVVEMTVDTGNSYELSAETNQHEINLDNELEINVVSYDVPEYQGSYTVDAGLSPVVLNTQDKRLTQNVTVNALTENRISSHTLTINQSNGRVSTSVQVTPGYNDATLYSNKNLNLSTEAGKTVTPTTSEQIAVARGKYTLGDVKVGALAENSVSMTDFTVSANSGVAAITSTVTSGYSATAKSTTTTVQLPTQAGTTITPTTSEQTAVAKGKYTTGIVKVGAIPSQYADITGVTAQASDVLAGKYFVDNLGVLTLGTGTGGGGLDTETKDALLECFEHVAWADSDGQIYYNNLLNALYPLQSISAVYTQSGTVYTDTPLDDLKSDLVVTATFDDGTTKEVTNYTLSGTLTAGTSTVTVTYYTETTTFNVTVTQPQPAVIVIDGTTLDWTRGYIDSSGNISTTGANTGTYSSGFFETSNKASYVLALNGASILRMAFFNANYNIISRVLTPSGDIPDNSVYARATVAKSSLGDSGYNGTGTTITLNP